MKIILKNKRLLLFLVIISCVLYLASQTIIIMILDPIGQGSVMRLQLSFNRESIMGILNRWGEAGIAVFMNHFYLDFFHPLIYSSFQFFLLLYIKSKLSKFQDAGDVPFYFFLPFAAAFFDLVENILELFIIGQRSNLTDGVAMLNGLVSMTKWALAIISILIIMALGVQLVVYSIKARMDKEHRSIP